MSSDRVLSWGQESMGTNWEFYHPGPDTVREAHERERAEFFRNRPLDGESNWRLILVQLDDFGGPDSFFDRCREELRRRGFSHADVGEMERIAHEFVAPYNDELPYSELRLYEELLEPAIEWGFGEGTIDEASRDALLEFARRCERQGGPPSNRSARTRMTPRPNPAQPVERPAPPREA